MLRVLPSAHAGTVSTASRAPEAVTPVLRSAAWILPLWSIRYWQAMPFFVGSPALGQCVVSFSKKLFVGPVSYGGFVARLAAGGAVDAAARLL